MGYLKKFLGLVACAAFLVGGPARAGDADKPLDIKPSASVDERLFLTYAGDHLLRTWSPGSTNPAEVQAWLDGRRAVIDRMTARAKAAGLDAELVDVLGGLRALADRQEAILADAGVIERRLAGQQQKDNFDTGYRAGQNAGKAYDAVRAKGGERRDAIGAAVVVGGIQAIFEAHERDRERTAARDAAARAGQREFQLQYDTATAKGREAVRVLAERHKWADGRAGLGGDQGDLGQLMGRRPADPFLRLRNAVIRTNKETAADVLNDARACVAAARLVPADSGYDVFRAWCLDTASELAASAASAAWMADRAHAYPSAPAAEAVRIVRTRLQYPDPTDRAKYDLARALNFAGRHADALRAIASAVKQHTDHGVAYDYACILSLNGDTKAALEWLAYSHRLGGNQVKWSRRDPDLAAVRRDRADEFDKLTEVTFNWRIDYGVFNDHVIVTNTSGFALTDVVLTPTIKRNGQMYTRALRVSYLAPRTSYTWSDVFSIPGSTHESATADLACRQSK